MSEKPNNDQVSFALLAQGVEHIKDKVDSINDQLNEIRINFISRKEFDAIIQANNSSCNDRLALMEEKIEPLKLIIYGQVGLILTVVLGALLKAIIA
jgi:hypothetical protein